ncbi:hypothetical protein Tco_0894742 [Tanacetum coccineum]|uniref:Uncharacterized protein n=1 Tax=Tanacetum coccineum TaxID=301880 RepID=A0ABQ5CCK1_9ASTR
MKKWLEILKAQLQAKLIKEERLARQKEEEANIALIKSWDNIQAMMEVDFELAQRLQAKEQGEINIEERSRLFVELMNRRKKHFAKLRVKELKKKATLQSFKEKLIETITEESSKRAGDELESDMLKKQKIDEITILEKEPDEFIKPSVEDLVPIPSEFEDTSDNDSECDIKSKESYVSNLDEQALLVTHLSKLNEDECFDPGGDKIEACFTSDSIPPRIDGADFDLEGDILLLEKLLNDDISFSLPPKELHFKGLKVIKSYIPPDFKDDYYDSEGDTIYLRALIFNGHSSLYPSGGVFLIARIMEGLSNDHGYVHVFTQTIQSLDVYYGYLIS